MVASVRSFLYSGVVDPYVESYKQFKFSFTETVNPLTHERISLSDRVIREVAATFLLVPVINLLVREIFRFYLHRTENTIALERNLDEWFESYQGDNHNAQEAKERILAAYNYSLLSHTRLSLSGLGLTSLPGCIGDLTNLTYLNLYDNQLQSLPESIGNLTNLTKLNLYSNQLQSLPESIGDLTNLTKLDLSSNQLQSLPESIWNLTNLTKLNLYSNQLQSLPESIGDLTNLTKLDLSSNQLQSLPESIGDLTNLTALGLGNNQLQSLPESIWNLTNLKVLYLSRNQLESLPDSIGNLTNLTELSLSGNQLQTLPDFLFYIPSLRDITVLNNRFTAQYVQTIHHRNVNNMIILVSIFEQLHAEGVGAFMPFFEQYINQIKADAGYEGDLSYATLSNEKKEAFRAFFEKVSASLVYMDPLKVKTAKLLVNSFLLADSNEDFKNVFIELCRESSTTCGDRAALGINNLYIQYHLYTEFPDDLTPLDFIVGLRRLELIDEKAINFIKNYQGLTSIDRLEVHISLGVRLKERLKLPVFSENLQYFTCSGLTDDDINRIGSEIEAETQDVDAILSASKIWEKYILDKYPEEYEKLSSEFELPDEENFEKYSDYQNAIDKVVADRNKAVRRFVQEKTEEFLKQQASN